MKNPARSQTSAGRESRFDPTDCRLLGILQAEGRLSNQEIAERAKLSPAACWRRIRALEEAGVIRGYRADLDRAALGLGLCVFVQVTLARHEAGNVARFESAIRERPEVLECHATTGDADFLLKVVAPDIRSYDRFLEEFLFALGGIAQLRSAITLREVKQTGLLPIG